MGLAITMIPVESSNLAAVGYQPASAVLTIAFRSGSVYEYFAVPQSVYHQLLTAASLGSYFAHFIRPVYPWARLA